MGDSIDRKAAIDQLHQSYNLLDAERRLEDMPSTQSEPIGYQECANALLKMWMDEVLTDEEYSKIIAKLNAHLIRMAYEEREHYDQ